MIKWWGIKVILEDGTVHYVTNIPNDVAKVVDSFLDEIELSDLEEEQK